MHNQATSVPFSADILLAHDSRLVRAYEFGTNVTDDIGDFFDWGAAGAVGYAAEMNARLGALQVTTGNPPPLDDRPPRGQSYRLPPTSEWPITTYPGFPVRGLLVWAHHWMQTGTPPGSYVDLASFILGPESALVGAVALPQQTGLELAMRQPPFVAGPPDLVPPVNWDANEWNAGVQTLGDSNTGTNGGGSRWWAAVLLFIEGEPSQYNCAVWGSRDGVSFSSAQPNAIIHSAEDLRFGAGVSGVFNRCLLDWVRCYAIPDTLPTDALVFPSGGRLFIP